jgi:hypothetical protein
MKAIPTLLAALLLAACEHPISLQGSMEDGSETFTGTATRYVDGGATIAITGNKGLSCTGLLVYQSKRGGRGTFNCSNGQSGPFEFVSTGTAGSGTGHIGSRPFTFIFG